MEKKYIDENYIHNCQEVKYKIDDYKKTIVQMGFTENEVIRIIDFYLLRAPLKKDSKETENNIVSLNDYGWNGKPDMSKLEGRLLAASGIANFCIRKTDSIECTLESMNLIDKICASHSRSALLQSHSVKVQEDGTIVISQKETRMECLFRHLRNSIAHNLTYLFPNDYILMEDRDENKKVSARILMPKRILLEWIEIVENKKDENKDQR